MSTSSPWKYAYSSSQGTSHLIHNIPCQDTSICKEYTLDDDVIVVAVVSDGAGSASYSHIGSQLACEMFCHTIETVKSSQLTEIDTTFVCDWILSFQKRIQLEADKVSSTIRDFACTFLATVVSASCSIFIQIGDGAIVCSDAVYDAPYTHIWWPDQGEYANQTYFLTDTNVSETLHFERRERTTEETALFSDGLQNLVLCYSNKSVHVPFFEKMFAPIRQASHGYSQHLSDQLSLFLNSERVNARTDDDKSLVLVSKRSAPPTVDTPKRSEHEATIEQSNGVQ